MPQNAEAAAFLERVARLPAGPGTSLDDVLKPSLDDEADLRKLFAQDKANPRLADKYVGLVDVFDAPKDIRTTRARVAASDDDLNAKYIMPLSEARRRKEGSPAMVDDFDDFKKNWSIFTEGSLSQLTDWSNVVAAGGSVQACLAPVPESAKASKRSLRKYFHNKAFPSSDVDLFLYGLTPEQAEVKINKIYEAVRDSIPWDVTCIRTKHTVSIHSQYPYRAVQIVLRLYQSPAEILAGFDVDAPCCVYDGNRVYASPRAIVAMMRQCNTVDVTRRSPSYEVRLTKYSNRDFEVFVPQLNRADIDPTIFERSIVRIQGLARLLVLERLATAQDREGYLQSRREIRGRPQQQNSWRRLLKKKYKGDLKADADAGLEMSDYDVVSLHIPYGPGWDARRIEKLVYQTDLGMNSPYNPKNKDRALHRHAAFFGTMPECLEDCCEHCPVPKGSEQRELQEEEDKSYVRGRVQFIVEDPGRQSISGSFNPIDDGEWSEQAYIGITEKFFNAIAAHDRATVGAAIKDGIDVNRRDHVGRTPLQVAVLSKATDIACDLIDANARMTARIVDGRTALHLAAQLNLPDIVRKMLERSAVNDEEAKAAAEKEAEEKVKKAQEKDDKMDTDEIDIEHSDAEDDEMRDSSEDDWSSDEDGAAKKNAANAEDDSGIIPEDAEDEPDVFQVDALDWDYMLSALDYAIAAGSVEVVDLLLANGANPKLVTAPKHSWQVRYVHPLILTATTHDDEKANRIAEKLIAAGAVTSEADDNLLTIFHRAVYSGRPSLVSTFLKADPNAKVVLSVPWMDGYSTAIFPIVSAVHDRAYSVLAILLAHGAKLIITRDDFQRARDMRMKNSNSAPQKFLSSTPMPIEVALGNYDDVVTLLAALGADLNMPTKDSLRYGNDIRDNHYTPLDWTRAAREKLVEAKSNDPSRTKTTNDNAPAATAVLGTTGLLGGGLHNTAMAALLPALPNPEASAWKTEFSDMVKTYDKAQAEKSAQTSVQRANIDDLKAYFEEMSDVLVAAQAKYGDEIWKSQEGSHDQRLSLVKSRINAYWWPSRNLTAIQKPFLFFRHGLGNRVELNALYEELYTACWNGDNAKIRKLCLPQPGRKVHDLPLQISVHWGNNWQGFTPLFVALHRRRWETAKLIMVIASSQYSPKEVRQTKTAMTVYNIEEPELCDDDAEEEDDVSTGVQEDIEIDLVDIAKIPTEVHCNTIPTYMLNNVSTPFVSKDGSAFFATPLTKAVMEDDFEAYVHILDLSMSLPDRPVPYDALSSLIVHDRPAMLDEYIRRTGLGADFKKKQSDENGSSEDSDADPDTSLKQYLGLNVHGKKRKDLATQNDPHAYTTNTCDDLPILWQAAKSGAIGIVRYLASDQPLAAYKYYASTQSDSRAKMIRQVPDLATVLPEKLGWTTSKLNESVATAAIVGGHADVLEALCTMRGKDFESTLHLKHRSKGFNSILAAARHAQDIKLFDFLLSKGVSPLETDHNGSNIYHILCMSYASGSFKLLKHAIKHLPKEITQRLFRQQTKEARCTPLAVAVKKGRIDIVRLFIEAEVSQFLVRDAEGYTPLQLAVKTNLPKLTALLAEAGPAEALTLEDGVGNTPHEVAARQAFLAQLDIACGNFRAPQPLQLNYNTRPFADLATYERELPHLRVTLDALLHEGRLAAGTKLAKELLAFADRLEAKIALEKAKAAEQETLEDSKVMNDVGPEAETDAGGTASEVLDVLNSALDARPTLRQLVHLSDVHESVTKSLERFSKKEKENQNLRQVAEDDGLPEEQEVTESALTQGWDGPAQSLANRY